MWLDGAQVLTASDRTITRPGRVGLVTYADSVALFDDFSAKSGTETGIRGTGNEK
jgi:hypothetical protein